MSSTRFRIMFAFAAVATFLAVTIVGAANARAIAGASRFQAGGDGVRRITPDEVRELLKTNKAVLVDVRSESAYKAGHIKGALWIPVNEIGERAKELPRNKMIVAYCS